MRFSVVVPVYNAETYLLEAIDSVINQGTDDFELILVNDGSTDASLSICEQAKEHYPDRVVLVDQENKGLFEARKSGVRAARGDYVVSLDADDKLAPDALVTLMRELEKSPVDILAFRCCKNEAFQADGLSAFHALAIDEKKENLRDMARNALLISDRINNVWLKCIRRDCLDDYVNSEMRNLLMAEDKIASAFALDSAQNYRQIESVLYYYRPNMMSITRRRFARRRFDDLETVFSCLLQYATKWSLEVDIPIMQALFLSQVCAEISSLYGADLSAANLKEEAAHIQGSSLFLAAMNDASMKALKVHKRVLVRLFVSSSPLINLYLELYNRCVTSAHKLQGR